jgi:O-antigen chain-terminating methyltransferase
MEDEFYIQFEDKFRGSRELIKDRLKVYLPIIKPLKAIFADMSAIDLGCGRGEWLELLRENGWQGIGIDTNKSMIDYCKEAGLNAINEDAIAYLRSIESETISVISGFHIAEHLPFDSLLDLVKEAHRILLPGGFLILETPNPENILVGTATFYLDPTHLHPIPAQQLSFLAEFYGFYRTKILRLQEPPDLAASENTDLLKVLTGVSPDYSIIAQKNAEKDVLAIFDKQLEIEYGLTLETLVHRYDSQIETTVQDFTKELSDIQKEINGIQTNFNILGSEHDRLLSDLHGARIDLQGLRVDLENVRGERDSLQIRLNEFQVDFQNVRDERDSLQIRLNEFQVDFQNVQAKRDELKASLDKVLSDQEAVHVELHDVYNSRSYRITAPMRAVFGILRVWRDKILRPNKIHKTIQDKANNPLSIETNSYTSLHSSIRDQSLPVKKSMISPPQAVLSPLEPEDKQEINLDEIMEKIREEVARRNALSLNPNEFASGGLEETGLFRFIKKVQSILSKLPFYKQVYGIAITIKTRIPKYQEPQITITDLLIYEDEAFIKNAYKTILKREADSVGYNYYLSMLRTGSLSKTKILGKLRYSPEGKQLKTKIKGLTFKYFAGLNF